VEADDGECRGSDIDLGDHFRNRRHVVAVQEQIAIRRWPPNRVRMSYLDAIAVVSASAST
jgi:hypothetical protein